MPGSQRRQVCRRPHALKDVAQHFSHGRAGAIRLSSLNRQQDLLVRIEIADRVAKKCVGRRHTRRIAADWQGRYGHRVALLETFVERGRFRGSCYRAANWIGAGQTQGRTRQDRRHVLQAPVKDVWVYPLQADFRKVLCP